MSDFIAVYGSYLRSRSPRDIDIVYRGFSPQMAEWVGSKYRAAEGRQDLPLDLHEHPPHAPIDVVDKSDGILCLRGTAPSLHVVTDYVSTSLRYIARHGTHREPPAWRERVAVDPSGEGYFGDGLQAVRTAWMKLDGNAQARDAARRRYGAVLDLLIRRDPTPNEIAGLAPGFPGGVAAGLDFADGVWRTTHGRSLVIVRDGALRYDSVVAS